MVDIAPSSPDKVDPATMRIRSVPSPDAGPVGEADASTSGTLLRVVVTQRTPVSIRWTHDANPHKGDEKRQDQ